MSRTNYSLLPSNTVDDREGGMSFHRPSTSGSFGGDKANDHFTRRRDFCLGFLILTAIVYVLARVGSSCDNSDNLAFISSTAANSDATILNSGGVPFDIGEYRKQILSQSTPHIIECIEAGEGGGSQEACHIPRDKRYAAINQKGITLWMTGLSGSGKSTIASLLEEQLVLQHGKAVYRLDGDNIRTGLNRDLGFSKADRAESVRRVGELACLFSDAGMITIVSLVSPYRDDREIVRKRHVDQKIKFLEVFMDVPLTVVQERDPKGLYKKVAAGELKGFTGVDDPYEAPTHAELNIKNQDMTIQESVDVIMRALVKEGVLVGGPVLPQGLPYPDGDEIIDLYVTSPTVLKTRLQYAAKLPKVLLTDIDVNWLQTIAEGWAAPLKGFMREGTLLQTLHFNSILVDPYNITGTKAMNEMQTDFLDFKSVPPKRVSMSVPITLSCTDYTKHMIELYFKQLKQQYKKSATTSSYDFDDESDSTSTTNKNYNNNNGNNSDQYKEEIALVNKHGQILAILRNPEIFANRKEEIVTRTFGIIDRGHPYIKYIYSGGDWLIGGEVEVLGRIQYNDGLDKFRLTAKETMAKFEEKGADAVYAFQTRNPTHAGHAYLMKTGKDILLKKGYKNPILWLSPLGGWTKSDDVPLDVRVKQHDAVLAEGMLDPKTTVMAIWPAPMIYAGPTEVLFHAKSRLQAGATYFVAGRDPAGMKGSSIAESHKDDDLYDGNHGRYVLTMSPGLESMSILPFGPVYYDKRDHVMKAKDMSRPDDFIEISGSKMRALAAQGAVPCDVNGGKSIPSDLLVANCIPPGFMVESGWKIVCDYYQNENNKKWIPYSVQNVKPFVDKSAKYEGIYGTDNFKIFPQVASTSAGTITNLIGSSSSSTIPKSPWHDITMHAYRESTDPLIKNYRFNFVVEIPMYSTAKLEVMKDVPGNPIMQDLNKDDSPRYFSYGIPFFNYGFLPQTWEDIYTIDEETGAKGDGDPIDVIEIGFEGALPIGTVVPIKILGSFALIDEGETDHKIVGIRESDPNFSKINSMSDLEKYSPGMTQNIVHWLKNYKTSDGKPVNKLKQDTSTTVEEALAILKEVHQSWVKLVKGETQNTMGYYLSPKPTSSSSSSSTSDK